MPRVFIVKKNKAIKTIEILLFITNLLLLWETIFEKQVKFFFCSAFPLECKWPIQVSTLKNHSPTGMSYSPLATGRVLMKRLHNFQEPI